MENRGFTLIEMIVAIAIISILATVVVPQSFRAIEKAKVQKCISDVRAITKAATAFRGDTGYWPGSQWGTMPGDALSPAGYGEGFVDRPTTHSGTALERASADSAMALGWDGPYLEKWGMTPWGMPYMWDWNNWDSSGNGVFPEFIVWLDLAHSPGPYNSNQKVPQHARILLDQLIDGGDGFTNGSVQTMNSGFYGDSVMVMVYEGN